MKLTIDKLIEKFPGTVPSDWQTTPETGWIHRDAKVAIGVVPGRDAILRGGEFRGGEFRGGTFWDGTFRGGTFWNGTFWGGAFNNGTFRGGMFWGGVFEGGTFWGGTFHGGTFEGGAFEGGAFHGGTFRGGMFHDGTFHGGTFHGGTFDGGMFWGGTFEGGAFWCGEILEGTWHRAPLFIQGTRYMAINAKPGHIKIGRRCEPFAWWLSPKAEAIAREAGYSDSDIAEHREIVNLFIKIGV